MATINLRKQSAQQLDIEKRALEARITPSIERIFKNMANDASNLYRATGNLPARELANNYSPEFLKEIRDAMRKSIKKFGFNLRKKVEKKHALFFDIETKIQLIDIQLKQSITIQDDDLEPKINQINNEFLVESTLFIANESENQNNYVTETNSNMLEAAVIAGIVAFSNDIAKKQEQVAELSTSLVTASPSEARKINRQIAAVTRQIDASTANQQAIVAENIETNLLQKAPARSELIASQNVGLAESWARQTEAELIDGAGLVAASGETVEVLKEWVSILDSRLRASHLAADGQQVGVNENFTVGGESAKYPRSPELSAAESINCRCISDFSV
jgi:hypothetical protein